MAKVRFWNVWWTLMVVSAAFTLVVVTLEAFGVFRDVGIALSIAGALLALIFGLVGSTRSSLAEFRGDVVPRLGGIAERLGRIERQLSGMDEGMGQRLDRIITLLDERLPRSTT